MTVPDLTFVLGGQRCGKSAFAEQLAQASGLAVTYIATAATSDEPEMQARIAHHRTSRPAEWPTIEAGRDLAEAIAAAAAPSRCLLVDCLPLWLAGWLCPPDDGPHDPADDTQWADVVDTLTSTMRNAPGKLIVVSNEIGLGVVPLGSLTRRYVDELGRLNQRVAALAPQVRFVVAGLPLAVKG